MRQQARQLIGQGRAHFVLPLDILPVNAGPQAFDDAQRGVDAQIGLDQQLFQLLPGLVSELIGLEEGADAAEQPLTGLGQAGLNFGLTLCPFIRGLAKQCHHVSP